MDKMKMESVNLIEENILKLSELFPNVITETKDENNNLVKKVNFELLKQELSEQIIDTHHERYEFRWVGKNAAINEANTPTKLTLRPIYEESKAWEKTQNIYIEGDNLEVLKIMQESYLNMVQMIYIDPPYNTGNDFIYNDSFNVDKETYEKEIGLYDDENNRLFKNTNSNGRFHSDWCNLIYPRLKLAQKLLKEDGVLFISIDDNELENTLKIGKEIFGEVNFAGIVTWDKKRKGSFLSKNIISMTEYCVVFCKDISKAKIVGGVADETESQPLIKRTNKPKTLEFPEDVVETKLVDGLYKKGKYGTGSSSVELLEDVIVEDGFIKSKLKIYGPFIWSQNKVNEQLGLDAKFIINTDSFQLRCFKKNDSTKYKGFPSLISGVEINGTNEDAYEELINLFDSEKIFDYSKPKNYVKEFIKSQTHFNKDAIIMDFFSGSASTAHAVMELNALDEGNRKFIMVQLDEKVNKNSNAFKNGYKTISDIGKERIRRVGENIKKQINKDKDDKGFNCVPDIGFRVFKLDSSNMKDIYYAANEYSQDMIASLESNIKEERTDLDLLYGVMIDWGLPLSLVHETEEIGNATVHIVEYGSLIACFDDNISDEVVTSIAKKQPLRVVFKDDSFDNSPDKINVTEIFKLYSPNTTVKVI
ncbi:site-specific DNA-methyltransferase [Allobacillus sp. SKP2-8]|uniref:site-specific DNA-methyltransferase n=1 Tax=unclassified Allobacillus TaxID=2628859 RepID=UPI001182FAB6|nr:site-specific DNA-methyltransferase [Allobacillus sp. SKP2-8]TSJ65135.1 site-specific DNA-methyltransferase [Allobacillus sp. SKP2-8]